MPSLEIAQFSRKFDCWRIPHTSIILSIGKKRKAIRRGNSGKNEKRLTLTHYLEGKDMLRLHGLQGSSSLKKGGFYGCKSYMR